MAYSIYKNSSPRSEKPSEGKRKDWEGRLNSLVSVSDMLTS